MNEQCCAQVAAQQPPGRPVMQLSIHINIPTQARHVKATLNYLVNEPPAVKRKWLQLQSAGKGSKMNVIMEVHHHSVRKSHIVHLFLFFFVCMRLTTNNAFQKER